MTAAPSRVETFKSVVGELARPFAIIVTGFSVAVTPIIIVCRMAPDRLDLIGAAALVGAGYAGHVGLYGFKSWEVARTGKQAADVEIARTPSAPPPPGTATITAAPDVDVTVRDASTEGTDNDTGARGPAARDAARGPGDRGVGADWRDNPGEGG